MPENSACMNSREFLSSKELPISSCPNFSYLADSNWVDITSLCLLLKEFPLFLLSVTKEKF